MSIFTLIFIRIERNICLNISNSCFWIFSVVKLTPSVSFYLLSALILHYHGDIFLRYEYSQHLLLTQSKHNNTVFQWCRFLYYTFSCQKLLKFSNTKGWVWRGQRCVKRMHRIVNILKISTAYKTIFGKNPNHVFLETHRMSSFYSSAAI